MRRGENSPARLICRLRLLNGRCGQDEKAIRREVRSVWVDGVLRDPSLRSGRQREQVTAATEQATAGTGTGGKEQVTAAPEYKEDTPIVVLGASGNLQPLQYGP